jgi:hypothetical protein
MQWEQYKELLEQKKSTIEEEITVRKYLLKHLQKIPARANFVILISSRYRGVSSDQIKDIEKSFSMFDTDNNGCIHFIVLSIILPNINFVDMLLISTSVN